MATISDIRYELSDTDPTFPLLSDDEIIYFLNKNSESLTRTSLDCARAILFKLSMREDSTVDIFSLKGSKAAESYRQALMMYLKDPSMNPALSLASIYAGGISKSDMKTNIDTEDNNAVRTPLDGHDDLPTLSFEL